MMESSQDSRISNVSDLLLLIPDATKDKIAERIKSYLASSGETAKALAAKQKKSSEFPARFGAISELDKPGVLPPTVDSVKASYATHTSNFEIAAQGTGKFSAKNNGVTVTGNHPPHASRDLQLAKYYAQRLLVFTRTFTQEHEVQVMVANKRILVSANNKGTLSTLKNKATRMLLTGLGDDIKTALRPDFSTQKASVRLIELQNQLTSATGAEEDGYLFHILLDACQHDNQNTGLHTLLAAVKENPPFVMADTPEAAAAALVSSDTAASVILVEPNGEGWHAEQNLMQVLIKSAFKGEALIQGTKRPCLLCGVSHQLMAQREYEIRCNPNVGGAFETATEGLAWISSELKFTQSQVDAAIKKFSQEQHVTGIGVEKQKATYSQIVNMHRDQNSDSEEGEEHGNFASSQGVKKRKSEDRQLKRSTTRFKTSTGFFVTLVDGIKPLSKELTEEVPTEISTTHAPARTMLTITDLERADDGKATAAKVEVKTGTGGWLSREIGGERYHQLALTAGDTVQEFYVYDTKGYYEKFMVSKTRSMQSSGGAGSRATQPVKTSPTTAKQQAPKIATRNCTVILEGTGTNYFLKSTPFKRTIPLRRGQPAVQIDGLGGAYLVIYEESDGKPRLVAKNEGFLAIRRGVEGKAKVHRILRGKQAPLNPGDSILYLTNSPEKEPEFGAGSLDMDEGSRYYELNYTITAD